MKVHAIQTGTVTVKERQRRGRGMGPTRVVGTMLAREWTDPLPILAWAVEHPDGLLVVDAGETARTAEPGWFPRWHPYFRLAVRFDVEPEQEIGPQLERRGLDPRDVRWVVLTHLHTDHVGGMSHLAEAAEVIVDRKEWKAAQGATGKLGGYLPHRWPEGVEPRLVDLPDDGLELAPGLTVVPTPGHSPGHMSVLVEDGDMRLLLAGDVSYDESCLLDCAVDGVAPDPKQAAATLRRILGICREAPTVYLPCHDPGSVERLEGRRPVPA